MDGDGWQFVVESAFNISGRGTGVVGTLTGVFDSNGAPADLAVGEDVYRIERAYLEFLRVDGRERRALMVYGVTAEQVPSGSVISGPVP